MSEIDFRLYATLFISMLKMDKSNCIAVFELVDLSLGRKIVLLEGTACLLTKDGAMTKEISDKIHTLYDKLLSNNPKYRNEIIESYNIVKGEFNTNKFDETNKLIFDDIIQRQFDVYDYSLARLYEKEAANYYINNYDSTLKDILFDFYVVEYLTHTFMELDNDICKDPRFIKSLKYIISLNLNNIDYEKFTKVKTTLDYRETLLNKGFIGKIKMKNEHKKIVKRLGNKYEL